MERLIWFLHLIYQQLLFRNTFILLLLYKREKQKSNLSINSSINFLKLTEIFKSNIQIFYFNENCIKFRTSSISRDK